MHITRWNRPKSQGIPNFGGIPIVMTSHSRKYVIISPKKSPKMRRREISPNYLCKKEQPSWKTEKLTLPSDFFLKMANCPVSSLILPLNYITMSSYFEYQVKSSTSFVTNSIWNFEVRPMGQRFQTKFLMEWRQISLKYLSCAQGMMVFVSIWGEKAVGLANLKKKSEGPGPMGLDLDHHFDLKMSNN